MKTTEYIKREVILNAIGDLFTICSHTLPNELGHHYVVEEEIETFYDYVKDMPASNVRPVVRGKWHDWYHMLMPDCYVATCSNCGKAHKYLGMGLLNYCPNCGANMRRDISSFTPEERKTYWEAIEKKSIDTGVNIHDLI